MSEQRPKRSLSYRYFSISRTAAWRRENLFAVSSTVIAGIVPVFITIVASTDAAASLLAAPVWIYLAIAFGAVALPLTWVLVSRIRSGGSKSKQVFVSYSMEDRDRAKPVVKELEKAGFTVWMPDGNVPMGARAVNAIAGALRESVAMVVLVPESGSARSSQVLYEEVRGAEALMRPKDARVSPIVTVRGKAVPEGWRELVDNRHALSIERDKPGWQDALRVAISAATGGSTR